MKRVTKAAALLLPAALAAAVYGQAAPEPPPSRSAGPSSSITREEYEQLRKDQDAMRREIIELRQQLVQERAARAAAPAPAVAAPTAPAPALGSTPAAPPAPAAEYATREDTDDLVKQVKSIRDDLDRNRFGTSNFHIAGDADISFTAQKNSHSSFSAGVAPLLLWQPEKDFLFEAAFDISGSTDDQNNSSTDFTLELANASYLVNDNLYIGAGLFVVPFGVYHRHFDPPWINKFPDDPLPFGDGGIAPGSETGFFLGGSMPIENAKLTYDLYVTNGPNLFTNADAAGQLNFDDYTDLNNGKAVGGRVGFLPIPNLEVGYSAMFARVDPDNFPSTNALLQAVDLNWRQDVDALYGQIDVRTEWVWSRVERATYDADGSQGFGPINFSNNRYGGYVQFCYRPTQAGSTMLRNFEFVSRYDLLRTPPAAPGGDREQRFTLGVDYWFTPSIVLKTAYEFDDKRSDTSTNAFLMQLGIGF